MDAVERSDGANMTLPTRSGMGAVNVAQLQRPRGTPGLLADRLLVQTSAGEQLRAVLPYIDPSLSGLVLSRGRMTNRTNLRQLINGLPDLGLKAPVVFDAEGYRRHVATTAAPFDLGRRQSMFGRTLDEHLSDQRALGADVALTPTGLIRRDGIDALAVAAERADRLDREDFMFTAPLEATILDDPALTERVWLILNGLRVPVALMLAGQLDPLDAQTGQRVRALRSFAAGPAHVAALRTDFNAFDMISHGGFTAAIGTGGSMRHVVDPDEGPKSIDPEDNSPSVLVERLGSWWRGSKIARVYGQKPAPLCPCVVCDGRRINRFLAREDSAEARAHGMVIWQQLADLMLAKPTLAERAEFWKTYCQGRIDEHSYLSVELRRAKPIRARPALRTWAQLSA